MKTAERKTAKPRIRPVAASYRKLATAFPLRPIRDDEEFAAAAGVLDELMRRELDDDEAEYLDVLADLMEQYERKNSPIPDASESDVLRLFMDDRKLSQPALAKETGISQSTISAVLNGTRGLTKEQVVKLAGFFNVSPAAFLPRQES